MGKLKPLKVTKRRCGWQKRLKKKTDVASQKPLLLESGLTFDYLNATEVMLRDICGWVVRKKPESSWDGRCHFSRKNLNHPKIYAYREAQDSHMEWPRGHPANPQVSHPRHHT